MCRLTTILFTVLLSGISLITFGQGGSQHLAVSGAAKEFFAIPEEGKLMPDFTLDKITHYKTTRASLKDFRGSWLVLDFWFPGCVNCIRNFPKTSEWQKKFDGKIQFILVGLNFQKYNGIERLYEKLRLAQKLELASAFDSTLSQRWGVNSMPDLFIIDPNGVLYARTGGSDITIEKLQSLIDGGEPSFIQANRKNVENKPKDQNQFDLDTAILFQSVLTKYQDDKFFIPAIDYQLKSKFYKRKGYKATGAHISSLYNIAFWGKWYWMSGGTDTLYKTTYRVPLVERNDSLILSTDDPLLRRVYYNYSLDIPDWRTANGEDLMRYMRNDLKNYFGYDASVENRNLPVWVLTANDDMVRKIRNTDGITDFNEKKFPNSSVGFSLKNVDIKTLMPYISIFLEEMDYVTFFDETNVSYKIDITVNALMTDINQVRKELQKNGFDLKKVERPMRAIILRKRMN